MSWYVIRTNPKCERKAAIWLRRAGLRVWVPKRTEAVPCGARYLPAWRGFLLVRFTDALTSHGVPRFAAARECFGVADFVYWSTRRGTIEPVPLKDSLVADYMGRQRRRDYDGAKQTAAERQARRARIRKGSTVRIAGDGAFAGFIGKVQNVDDDVVRLFVELFGRKTPVLIREWEDKLEPVASRRMAA